MKNVMIFALGAAVGSLVTWKLIEKKYKDIADEEIESVVEHFRNKERLVEQFAEEDRKENRDTKYTKMVENLGYNNVEEDVEEENNTDYTVTVEQGEEQVMPYIITVDEYGELDDYEVKSWMYYSDRILADDDEQIVGNPEIYIGDALSLLGEGAEECVYVRNENNKCDYEVLLSEKTYDEANGIDY